VLRLARNRGSRVTVFRMNQAEGTTKVVGASKVRVPLAVELRRRVARAHEVRMAIRPGGLDAAARWPYAPRGRTRWNVKRVPGADVYVTEGRADSGSPNYHELTLMRGTVILVRACDVHESLLSETRDALLALARLVQ
jgi:hypothetical protein